MFLTRGESNLGFTFGTRHTYVKYLSKWEDCTKFVYRKLLVCYMCCASSGIPGPSTEYMGSECPLMIHRLLCQESSFCS